MSSPLENLRIVLVGTQHPGNIGSAARAMKVMGLRQLHLVGPERFPDREAHALAAGADDVLEQARVHASLAEALAGCGYAVATTARQRRVSMPMLEVREAAARLVEAATQGPVALVFGRERNGLENDEVTACHATVTLPADPGYTSLNLAAAVQVLCYELRMAWLARTDAAAPAGDADPEDLPAEHEQLERFFAHLGELLEDIDFNKGRSTETLMRRLRRLFLRAAPSRREIRILRGIFSEAQRAARQGAGHAAGGGLG